MPISSLIFRTPTETYRVIKLEKNTKMRLGYAYLMSKYNDYVYPYRGEVNDRDEAIKPGLYTIVGHESRYMVMPTTDDDRFMYNKSRIMTLTPESIFKNLDSVALDPILDREPIGDSDIFNPPIKGSDDIMLAGMKHCIGEKHISFNQYSHKFPDSATKNNGRRALSAGDSLSCTMAGRFSDVFDINIGIVFWDKPGAPHPMDPSYSTVYAVFDNEPLDFKDPNIKFVKIEKD